MQSISSSLLMCMDIQLLSKMINFKVHKIGKELFTADSKNFPQQTLDRKHGFTFVLLFYQFKENVQL